MLTYIHTYIWYIYTIEFVYCFSRKNFSSLLFHHYPAGCVFDTYVYICMIVASKQFLCLLVYMCGWTIQQRLSLDTVYGWHAFLLVLTCVLTTATCHTLPSINLGAQATDFALTLYTRDIHLSCMFVLLSLHVCMHVYISALSPPPASLLLRNLLLNQFYYHNFFWFVIVVLVLDKCNKFVIALLLRPLPLLCLILLRVSFVRV